MPTGCSPSTARPATPRSSPGLHSECTAPSWPTASRRIRRGFKPPRGQETRWHHAAYEFGGGVTALPAGDVCLDTINQPPPQERHLAVHDQHLVALNNADTAAWAAGSWKAITQTTMTGTADQIGRRVTELAAQGITEIIYQPTGPDITGELKAFHAVARNATSPAA